MLRRHRNSLGGGVKCGAVTVLPTVTKNGKSQFMLIDPVPHRYKLIIQKSQYMVFKYFKQ